MLLCIFITIYVSVYVRMNCNQEEQHLGRGMTANVVTKLGV